MTIRLVRVFFVILSVVCGYYFGSMLTNFTAQGAALGATIGFIAAVALIFTEVKLQHVSLRNLSAGAFGLVFGFLMAWIVTLIVRLIPMDEVIYSGIQIIFTLIFSYLGMTISIKGKDEFNLVIPYVRFSREDQREQLFLLDTSVIIDGRVAGICETGFLTGKLVIPRFVLHELQQIADSPDDAKRNRGRRGLDMLNRLKKTEGVEVIIHDEALSEIKGVDAKLVRLGKILACNVLTNDFNLNKVAKIEGVKVLNINDLADSLKPVVFPGEQMAVYIRKEGKERNQGVAFMDDGTMIVVDDARKYIGRTVNVIISSVLQTSAGRMIFAALIERPGQERQEERPQGRRDDRSRPERPERADRSERHDRPERPERQDRQQDNRHNDRRSERHDRDRQDRHERHDRPERQDRPERDNRDNDNQGRQQGEQQQDDRRHENNRDQNERKEHEQEHHGRHEHHEHHEHREHQPEPQPQEQPPANNDQGAPQENKGDQAQQG